VNEDEADADADDVLASMITEVEKFSSKERLKQENRSKNSKGILDQLSDSC